MRSQVFTVRAVLLCGLLSAAFVSPTVFAQPPSGASAVGSHDKDDDQTLDLAEVKTAAGAHFDKLDKDADGTLDAKEVKGVVSPKLFKDADPDNDGTLSKDEYLALVEKLFNKADVDHDGTLSVKELRSPAAHALRRLID
jgi:Ca2+-binding EF-hand superfamily protein